jgi:protein-tyrosine phosphatase
VLLVEDHELRDCQVPDIADVMAAHGIDLIRHPIDAGSGPADRPEFGRLLDDILARVARGQDVVVACRAGFARTGTVVACVLRDAGLDGPAAIALTCATRPGTIEHRDQERFVETWGDR